MRVTATAMTKGGPSDRKILGEGRVIAREAAMTTQTAGAIISPM